MYIMKKKIVIWGASGHAMVVADIIRLQGEYEIFGFLDNINPTRHNTEFCGATILGGGEQLDAIRKKGVKHIVFGFADNVARNRLAREVLEMELSLATIIHPAAVVSKDASMGAGSVVCAGAVIGPGAKIGENVIVNTHTGVEHECIIGKGVHLGPGVNLGGKVNIAEAAWIGIGAVIKDRVSIGAGSIIGAGSVVLEDIPEGVLAYGVPAKVIKEIKADGR